MSVFVFSSLAAVAHAAHALPEATVATCSAAQLSASCVQRALERDGAVALTDLPGLRSARLAALTKVGACAADEAGGARATVLPDGTVRRTFGSRTLHGAAEPMGGACAGLDEAAAPLRALVDAASRRLLAALQPLQRAANAMLADEGSAYPSLASLADAGEQLEHFHAYQPMPRGGQEAAHGPTTTAGPAPAAVPAHTDAGLFIAIVPALWLQLPPPKSATGEGSPGLQPVPSPEHAAAEAAGHAAGGYANGGAGFYIERRGGGRARLPAAAESSSVLFVVGQARARPSPPACHTQRNHGCRISPLALRSTP